MTNTTLSSKHQDLTRSLLNFYVWSFYSLIFFKMFFILFVYLYRKACILFECMHTRISISLDHVFSLTSLNCLREPGQCMCWHLAIFVLLIALNWIHTDRTFSVATETFGSITSSGGLQYYRSEPFYCSLTALILWRIDSHNIITSLACYIPSFVLY